MRFRVFARPRAAKSAVGGHRDGALVVAVTEPPVDGRANEAVRRAVARAFGVPHGAVTLVAGSSARHKTVEVAGDEEALRAVLDGLLSGPTGPGTRGGA
ncbi:MAG TPA: DUF167 domain-containing protein [Acidimicrobiales bacterium]|nr:DUF167 domain-containing protein [Acidimicrobiales bacterium]